MYWVLWALFIYIPGGVVAPLVVTIWIERKEDRAHRRQIEMTYLFTQEDIEWYARHMRIGLPPDS